jgi:hypothetical protein
MSLLDLPLPRKTRRNHAIEHAAVHVLSGRSPTTSMAGRSDAGGFFLYGNVETDDVRSAVDEAIVRLVDEPELAIHPHCGTNLVVGGLTAGVASVLAVATLSNDRRQQGLWQLVPRFLLAGTAAALASANLGPVVQRRWTTLADSEGVRVKDITRRQRGRHIIHRVELEDGG